MSLKVLLVVALLMSAVLAAVPKPHELDGYSFEQYVKDFGKTYDSKEYFRRKALFLRTLVDVVKHNHDGSKSYVKGVNHMSDWSEEEFSRLNGNHQLSMGRLANKKLQKKYKSSNAPLPAQVDYRSRVPAVLSGIKNQGHCGSCWAHSSVEEIEAHAALATGKVFVLSTQQMTSCTSNPNHCGGTGGCYGATSELGYEYVHNAGGISEEWAYSYTSYYGESGTCDDSTSKVVKVKGYTVPEHNDQDAVLDALVHAGPLAIAIDASDYRSYAGGVFDGCDYSKNITINHGVQLVGYGRDAGLGKDYWIIRNSWGPNWGEQGYMRMLKTDKVECGWNVDAHTGTACDDDPDQEWVCGMCGILSTTSYPIIEV